MTRIPTRTRNPISRALSALWQACEDHQWLPLAVVGVLLVIINSPLF